MRYWKTTSALRWRAILSEKSLNIVTNCVIAKKAPTPCGFSFTWGIDFEFFTETRWKIEDEGNHLWLGYFMQTSKKVETFKFMFSIIDKVQWKYNKLDSRSRSHSSVAPWKSAGKRVSRRSFDNVNGREVLNNMKKSLVSKRFCLMRFKLKVNFFIQVTSSSFH